MKYVRIEGEIAYVQLSRGQVAMIDAADVPLVAEYSWHAIPSTVGCFYARSNGGLYMHRLITDAPSGLEVDHVNHDTLDNRRVNLRVGTHKENMANGRFALTTHCPKGHAYDDANTYQNKKGKRICRACNAMRVSSVYANETPEQRELRRKRGKEYHEKNKPERMEKMRQYALDHKEQKRAYDKSRRVITNALRREREKISRAESV